MLYKTCSSVLQAALSIMVSLWNDPHRCPDASLPHAGASNTQAPDLRSDLDVLHHDVHVLWLQPIGRVARPASYLVYRSSTRGGGR